MVEVERKIRADQESARLRIRAALDGLRDKGYDKAFVRSLLMDEMQHGAACNDDNWRGGEDTAIWHASRCSCVVGDGRCLNGFCEDQTNEHEDTDA